METLGGFDTLYWVSGCSKKSRLSRGSKPEPQIVLGGWTIKGMVRNTRLAIKITHAKILRKSIPRTLFTPLHSPPYFPFEEIHLGSLNYFVKYHRWEVWIPIESLASVRAAVSGYLTWPRAMHRRRINNGLTTPSMWSRRVLEVDELLSAVIEELQNYFAEGETLIVDCYHTPLGSPMPQTGCVGDCHPGLASRTTARTLDSTAQWYLRNCRNTRETGIR